MFKMKDLTVTIDRARGADKQAAKAAINEVLETLKPLRLRGLRVRVTRSPSKEDKADS
jgi:hypothetical protein